MREMRINSISFHSFAWILFRLFYGSQLYDPRATTFLAGEEASESEIAAQLRQWDGDGDGHVNFAEFLEAMTRLLTDTDNEERMRQAFRMFDQVNDKALSKTTYTALSLEVLVFQAFFGYQAKYYGIESSQFHTSSWSFPDFLGLQVTRFVTCMPSFLPLSNCIKLRIKYVVVW